MNSVKLLSVRPWNSLISSGSKHVQNMPFSCPQTCTCLHTHTPLSSWGQWAIRLFLLVPKSIVMQGKKKRRVRVVFTHQGYIQTSWHDGANNAWTLPYYGHASSLWIPELYYIQGITVLKWRMIMMLFRKLLEKQRVQNYNLVFCPCSFLWPLLTLIKRGTNPPSASMQHTQWMLWHSYGSSVTLIRGKLRKQAAGICQNAGYAILQKLAYLHKKLTIGLTVYWFEVGWHDLHVCPIRECFLCCCFQMQKLFKGEIFLIHGMYAINIVLLVCCLRVHTACRCDVRNGFTWY